MMISRTVLVFCLCATAFGCKQVSQPQPESNIPNPVNYFEIPVDDLQRAVKFYESVFECKLETKAIDGNQMAVFQGSLNGPGIFGALAFGPSYKPSTDGTRVYFATKSTDDVLGRVLKHGGRIAYPKTDIGEIGFVAEFVDSEGNRIALHEPPIPN